VAPVSEELLVRLPNASVDAVCGVAAARGTQSDVPKSIREQIGKGPGDVVKIVLWKDEAPREVDVPAEFKALMKKAGVLPFFEGLSFTHRKEYCRWITEAKKVETRARRLEKALEMLKTGVRTPD
jgi:hypothetical protein